jgi:acetyl-CoA synthetase
MKLATLTKDFLLLVLAASFSNNQKAEGFSVNKLQLRTSKLYSSSSTEAPVTTSRKDKKMDEVHHIEPVYETKTISDFEKYKKQYAESIARPAHFWSEQATRRLTWERPFDPHAVLQGSLDHGDVTWFRGGKLNICFNAIDRHVNSKKANELAMVWEGDEPDDIRRITYVEMLRKVSQIANALKAEGVKKGDVVTIYMPMIPGKFTDTLFVLYILISCF